MDQLYERDCTSKCRSPAHAKEIFTCIPTSTASQIRAYSVWVCHNFSIITDDIGRNILHIASACGKWETVDWLIKNCNVDIDIKDHESGWTALHRSLYYGQLSVARVLCNLGANLKIQDHEGFTPLDIILKDRLPYIEYIPSHPCEVYVWGSNFNYNLGLGNAQNRTVPEILDVFRKDAINIKQVKICKFHTAFLSTEGKVYTCGSGHGGRLGQGNNEISLTPTLIKGMGAFNCIQIAAGQDHLLMLVEGGQVWSCGLNTYHQLGHIPPDEQCLIPKIIPLKFLKEKVIGICAARFHSVIYTKDSVYTFGLNAGQLGHPKGDRTQINPRQVSTLYNESWSITHVESSDGATVCATSRGDVYVLHEYQTRKIASRLLDISKLSIIGGNLDYRVCVAGITEERGLELRVMLLTKSGKIYLWRQTDPYLRRCLFNLQKELIILDVHLNHNSVGFITTDNEGYIGKIVPSKSPRPAPTMHLHTSTILNSKAMHGLNFLLDTDECNFINVKRLPHIYRGTSITSDAKGRNFAILQSNPKMGLVETPLLSDSEMLQDFTKFYNNTCIGDDFQDIIIKVGNREFPAHKYILAYRSDFFKKKFAAQNFEIGTFTLENVIPEAFEQVLKFIYSNHCDFLTHGYEVNWNLKIEKEKKKKSSFKNSETINPLVILKNTSTSLGVKKLSKRLESVKLINGQISLTESLLPEKITFDRQALPQLCDITLCSIEGLVYHCHKCILAARLDYFHSMLSTFWAESSHLKNISLPISSKVMEVILDFIYADKANKVLASENPEFLCHVLLITDQLMITRLKESCEMALVELITIKNVGELLELASIYNSQQLKRSCMQFICINLEAVIEAKVLDVLNDDVIQDLSSYYRSLVPTMHKRRLHFSNSPSLDTLEFIEKNFPIDCDTMFIRNRLNLQDVKTKIKHRSSFIHSESKDNPPKCRNKSNSESSEKDIVLNMMVTDIKTELASFHDKNKQEQLNESVKVEKQSQRILQCLNPDDFLSLNEIKEEKLTVLYKKTSSHDIKPFPRMSQKQKKLMENNKTKTSDILIPSSPPARNSCPWAKPLQLSPSSPSFWDRVDKKDSPPVLNSDLFNSKLSSPPCDKTFDNLSSPLQLNTEESVMSLDEIQKNEEKKLERAVNPKIKPLHILNIEDQAIEELLVMYNAKENPKERIIISRVVPEEIPSPVWRKHKC